MKVLLRKDVDNLGYAGDIKKVANGYGRNYLLPRGLAILATQKAVKEAEAWRQKASARREQLRAEYEQLSKRIADTTLNFEAKAGETGKLYGSVTTNEVANQLNETLGIDIDRRKVIGEPLRELGSHKIVVRLSPDFQPQVTVIINQEGATEEDNAVSEDVVEGAEEEESVEEVVSTTEEVEEVVEEIVAGGKKEILE